MAQHDGLAAIWAKRAPLERYQPAMGKPKLTNDFANKSDILKWADKDRG
jgi:hypothetical protein